MGWTNGHFTCGSIHAMVIYLGFTYTLGKDISLLHSIQTDCGAHSTAILKTITSGKGSLKHTAVTYNKMWRQNELKHKTNLTL
jgi:hypothetical protein